ncbi:alanine racemase [Bacillus lacus]|uniref:Alanine racemase n=1 Tax=Metabacillus lacus TaxID=1983721 RepID=A0A7X2IYE3_9BACI|nr:alanine racemase [Metabacillus lacus]
MNDAVYYRDTWAEINLDAIEYNIKQMKQHIGTTTGLIAVVKANAYGHGYAQVAEAALKAGADMLAVAFLDEGILLRKAGLTVPILVMGAARPRDIQAAIDYQLTLTVFHRNWLKEAAAFHRMGKLQFHIKLDTGMGRLGIKSKSELEEVLKDSCSSDFAEAKGIFTHFSTADELDSSYFQEQFGKFETLIKGLQNTGMMIHCGNSATGLRFPERLFNALRFGISMYGLAPSSEMRGILPFPLKEAFSLHTKAVQVKKMAEGEKVSYGAVYEAEKEVWIATLPIGYADGWIRRLQHSEVLVNGKRAPIVGRICMDQCMIALTEPVPLGTQVTLIGSQGKEVIPVDEVAERLDTINYEITCSISTRVPRVYTRDGKVEEIVNFLLK